MPVRSSDAEARAPAVTPTQRAPTRAQQGTRGSRRVPCDRQRAPRQRERARWSAQWPPRDVHPAARDVQGTTRHDHRPQLRANALRGARTSLSGDQIEDRGTHNGGQGSRSTLTVGSGYDMNRPGIAGDSKL